MSTSEYRELVADSVFFHFALQEEFVKPAEEIDGESRSFSALGFFLERRSYYLLSLSNSQESTDLLSDRACFTLEVLRMPSRSLRLGSATRGEESRFLRVSWFLFPFLSTPILTIVSS